MRVDRFLALLLAGAGLFGLRFAEPAVARTIPDLNPSYANADPGVLLIRPDGAGPTLLDRGCEIELVVLNTSLIPIEGYPYQDMWLDDVGNGDLSICVGGALADANTDADGRTWFTGAVAGGGWTQAGILVYLGGTPLEGLPLDIQVNSPDIDGDTAVGLTDLGIFAEDYASGEMPFRSDFVHDGVLNLSDIAVMADALQARCP